MSKITENEILANKTDEYFRNNDCLFETFHEKTKLNLLKQKMLGKKITSVIRDKNFQEAAPMAYKTYTTVEKIYLDRNSALDTDLTFDEIITNRRSVRNFDPNKAMTLKELSQILYLSYGINDYLPSKDDKSMQMLRSVPSAGGLYPLEIYIMVMNVDGLDKGLYHYNVKFHALEKLKEGDQSFNLINLTSFHDLAENASVAIFISAMFHRVMFKYGDRGYRFVNIDAGHLGQNIYLISTALGLGSLALGGFYDDELNKYLGIDGISEASVYEFIIGKPNLESDFRLLPDKSNKGKNIK